MNLGSEPIFVEVKGRSREIGPNRLLVVRNKLGEPYTVPLNRIARTLLASLREDATKPELVFKSIVNGLNITDIKRAYNSAREDAKMSDLTVHDLRHAFTTWAAECGVPLHVRRSLLGHSPGSMTESYTHATREAEEQAVEAVANYFEHHAVTAKVTANAKRAAA